VFGNNGCRSACSSLATTVGDMTDGPSEIEGREKVPNILSGRVDVNTSSTSRNPSSISSENNQTMRKGRHINPESHSGVGRILADCGSS
jgi:hypothetical protein